MCSLASLTQCRAWPLCSSRCCHTLPSTHLCSGHDPALLWIHGEEGPQPKPCYGPGRAEEGKQEWAGWWTSEKPSSPTPCLCKQTLVGPFSAPGTSLRNTGDWLQLYLGRARWSTKPAATLFCPLPPCRAGFCWVNAQYLQRLTPGPDHHQGLRHKNQCRVGQTT